MKEYEMPEAKLVLIDNDLLTASGEDNPPEPCKCYSYPTYSSDPFGEDDCMRADQWGGFETRSSV